MGADVGIVHLDDVESGDRTASWGFYIGEPSARGSGVATAALTRVLEIAFDELQLSKVRAEVLDFKHSVARVARTSWVHACW